MAKLAKWLTASATGLKSLVLVFDFSLPIWPGDEEVDETNEFVFDVDWGVDNKCELSLNSTN